MEAIEFLYAQEAFLYGKKFQKFLFYGKKSIFHFLPFGLMHNLKLKGLHYDRPLIRLRMIL